VVRTRWEGYGDPPTFQADNSWKAASSLDTVSWLSALSETSSAESTGGGRDHLVVSTPDPSRDHQSLDVISNLLKLVTADRSSHSSRYVATYAPYASENLTKRWSSPVSSPTTENAFWESAASGSDPRSDIGSPTTPPSARSVKSIQQGTIPGGGSVLPRRRDFRRFARVDNRWDSHDTPASNPQ